ncbi:hypothetical protein [Candidatus Nanohalococcus occultus]|uniref:Uncharacterized protein n=1 Tax=Candidatus Nanohalococcus occultus TaxID=2978047 RepID=A0ABY8CDY5_9ARCH|nr:hypothetical protein SVXNc_0403 [Candidatus Nanohaloarchaeota archaeon SVXNc]
MRGRTIADYTGGGIPDDAKSINQLEVDELAGEILEESPGYEEA